MDFYKRAAFVCSHIPRGKVATYGQIALLCGKPKNARQVGYALRTGKLGKNVPAYRVVNAKGVLSGAAAFDTYDMQRRLLETEGVEIVCTEEGFKTDLSKYGWKSTEEDALRFHMEFVRENI